MALTQCRECSKSISDSAECCPSCGYQLKRNLAGSSNTRKVMLILSIFLGTFGAIVGFSVGNPVFGAVGAIVVVIGAFNLKSSLPFN
jgi:hypothetical protein